jgi:putative ATP-dependent endonuclease of OLD family
MLLKKVTIENFRAFTKIELDLDVTTVLIAENNSGKSAFLDAIKFALRPLPRWANPFEDYDYHLEKKESKPGDSGDIKITLEFSESSENEWSDALVQAFADAVVFDGVLRKITLRVRSGRDPGTNELITDWDFLDAAGNPLPKAKKPQLLSDLQRIRPLFSLSALRDAGKEFTSRSSFWAPFLKNHSIPENVIKELEKDLGGLNEKIISANTQLLSVKERLAKTKDVVSVSNKNTVNIEALPLRLWDMLSRTQVNIASPAGVVLPLTRHGAGTQSLSVILLFEAFVESALKQSYDPLSEPILALEEPEAHLHPSATRVLWKILSDLRGQKIIATHSGDLLSEVPIDAIRRFYRTKTTIEGRKINLQNLSADEQRKIAFHVQASRGELFFARCWLLAEGETEYWILSGAAKVLGINLEQIGIRIVTHRHLGVISLAKVANELGIEWHCLADNDGQGRQDVQSVLPHLNGKTQDERVTQLRYENIELMLCNEGFGQIYVNHVSPQKVARITSQPGQADYWKQVLDAQRDEPKPQVAIEIVQEMENRGVASVPAVIKDSLTKAVSLAKT